jgi:hypothetical protein
MSFYENLYEVWGKNIKSLGWGSEQSQRCRFSILLRQDIEEGDTILDVGCGFADLKVFLLEQGYDNKYTGVEKEEQFRKIALTTHEDIDIFPSISKAFYKKYDWVFASGIFCFANSKNEWLLETTKLIDELYSACVKGTVINFLYGSGNNKKMHYTNLIEVSKIITNVGVEKFNIYSDYKNNDISLALYK